MYNKVLKSVTCLMIGTCLMSSCIGSFGLFNKVLDWNQQATNSKFLNWIIFVLISPAYVLCGVADLMVINSIEFWSGSNPLAENVGNDPIGAMASVLPTWYLVPFTIVSVMGLMSAAIMDNYSNGLALLSDLNDYPLDNDVYHCIGRVQAKPFSLDFDEQVESANVLYGSHLRCSFTRSDITSILKSFSDFYPQEILSRVERVLFEQIRRYSIYFI